MMQEKARKLGIDIIDEAPWGTHLCQFYKTKEDLADILVPYFKTGLENNEFCMWITSDPLDVETAKSALKKAVKDFGDYEDKSQIEILNYSDWYTKSGEFDSDEVLQGWVEREKKAIERGFDGLRLTGNTFWLEKKDWNAFKEYEEAIDNVIGNYRMIAICSYSLNKCGASEIMDVVGNHEFAIIRREGRWESIKNARRIRAEESSKESEAKYLQLFNTVPAAIILYDAETKELIDGNDAAFDMYGYSREEFLNLTYWDITAEPEKTKEILPQVLSGEVKKIPLRYQKKKDGSIFPLEGAVGVFKLNNRKVICGVTTDISEYLESQDKLEKTNQELRDEIQNREQAEDALRESEENFRTIYENIPIMICSFDSKMHCLLWNKECEKVFGWTREELNAMDDPFSQLYPDPEVRNLVLKRIKERSGEFGDGEWEVHTKDGSVRIHKWADFKANFDVQIGVGYDITKRKQAEAALRESEERYRQLVNHAPAGICEFDLRNQKFISVNDVVSEFTGYSKEELFSMNPFDLLTEDSQKLSRERLGKLLSGEPTPETVEYKIKTKNGSKLWVLWNARFVYEEEKPIRATVVVHDITERKKAAQALQESEEKYRRLVENALVGVYQVEKAGKFIMANKKMAEMFGYDSSESLISSVDSIANLHVRPEARTAILQEIDAKGSVYGKTVELRKKDGEKFWIKYHTRALREKEKTIYEGLMEDITESRRAEEERKKLEDQLHRAQKMESLGLMAGGIAHDLNNILSGIVSYPELLLMDLPQDSPLRKPIETIKESGMRAADVVSDLLTIARGVATGKKILNLNTIVTEYLGSAEHQKLEKTHSFVDFKFELDSDLLNLSGSSIHINKTLMNLVANAAEAIEGGGIVTISTANRYLDEPLKGYENVRLGEYAVLRISDDGSGISPQDLERIFEPFYTKKVMGRSGTGLGLAVVWNTLQDHEGYINVKTSKKGTTFELYFPVTRDEVVIEGDAVPVEDYLGHRERVLVVDDEKRQREISCGILTKLGYTAEAVSSGEEAVEYLKEQSVDLVVLDMIMPKGINGCETYERIIKIHPGQKAIIASGYAETSDVKKAQRLGAGKYIKKPYTMGKIGVAVKKELEK